MLLACICLLQLIGFIDCRMSPKVVGGRYANIIEFPYSVSLLIKCVNYNEISYWVCGSSIINQRLLLTAAHCVADCLAGSVISASVGSESKRGGKYYNANSVLVHENYMEGHCEYDIGLVKINTAITLNTKVSRVILMRNPPYTEIAFVAGWGVTSEIIPKSAKFLKFVDQIVLSREKCEAILHSKHDGTFCATSRNKGTYVAVGDSGSALVVRGYIQIGIVSFKKPSLSLNVVVYTDTGYYYTWIMTNAEKLYCGIF